MEKLEVIKCIGYCAHASFYWANAMRYTLGQSILNTEKKKNYKIIKRLTITEVYIRIGRNSDGRFSFSMV